jgi:hypothetical protein
MALLSLTRATPTTSKRYVMPFSRPIFEANSNLHTIRSSSSPSPQKNVSEAESDDNDESRFAEMSREFLFFRFILPRSFVIGRLDVIQILNEISFESLMRALAHTHSQPH